MSPSSIIAKTSAVKSRFCVLMNLCRVLLPSPSSAYWTHRTICSITSCSTKCPAEVESLKEEKTDRAKDTVKVLKSWGCSDDDVGKLFARSPGLRNANIAQLESKLNLLSSLGVTASELVKIVTCRPRFLSYRINDGFDEQLEYFVSFFESKEGLVKAIVRNPSLLTHDLRNNIKPAMEFYEELGLSKKDLTAMLMLRPTLISRTSFDSEKIEYVRKTRVPNTSKLYKYIVTLIGVSRIETLREKIANLERFGFTEDEILGLFGRSPVVLTLSVDKVQRNMTFVLGTMRLSAEVVLRYPNLLYSNIESTLRPRFLLAQKTREMKLARQIEGRDMMRAMRMKEDRFVRAFLATQPADVCAELSDFYARVKEMKRLAVTSKKKLHHGFPF